MHKLGARGHRWQPARKTPPPAVAATIAALNPLDAAVHAAAKRAFAKHVAAYGGEDVLRRDVLLHSLLLKVHLLRWFRP